MTKYEVIKFDKLDANNVLRNLASHKAKYVFDNDKKYLSVSLFYNRRLTLKWYDKNPNIDEVCRVASKYGIQRWVDKDWRNNIGVDVAFIHTCKKDETDVEKQYCILEVRNSRETYAGKYGIYQECVEKYFDYKDKGLDSWDILKQSIENKPIQECNFIKESTDD